MIIARGGGTVPIRALALTNSSAGAMRADRIWIRVRESSAGPRSAPPHAHGRPGRARAPGATKGETCPHRESTKPSEIRKAAGEPGDFGVRRLDVPRTSYLTTLPRHSDTALSYFSVHSSGPWPSGRLIPSGPEALQSPPLLLPPYYFQFTSTPMRFPYFPVLRLGQGSPRASPRLATAQSARLCSSSSRRGPSSI